MNNVTCILLVPASNIALVLRSDSQQRKITTGFPSQRVNYTESVSMSCSKHFEQGRQSLNEPISVHSLKTSFNTLGSGQNGLGWWRIYVSLRLNELNGCFFKHLLSKPLSTLDPFINKVTFFQKRFYGHNFIDCMWPLNIGNLDLRYVSLDNPQALIEYGHTAYLVDLSSVG